MENNKAKGSYCFGIILLVLSFLVIYFSRSFPEFKSGDKVLPGPRFFPILLSVFFIIAGVVEIYRAYKSDRKLFIKINFKYLLNKGNLDLLLLVGLLLIYVPLINKLGFIIGSVIFTVILMLRLNVPLFKSILVSILGITVIQIMFEKLFMIYLPDGLLSNLF